VPFGVPDHARGVGIGLAALVHAFARVHGSSIALAQLFPKPDTRAEAAAGRPGSGLARPIEAFIPPHTWKELSGDGPRDFATIVLTGAFDPPSDSASGMLQLLAYDAESSVVRGSVEMPLDAKNTGSSICDALRALCIDMDADLGYFSGIDDLDWDSLQSVLLAERCALHDPHRSGPYDRLAALTHLGRSIEDAPEARFAAGRMAAFALDTVHSACDARLGEAALRAIVRAVSDAPHHEELTLAAAALELRLGRPADAEFRLLQRGPGLSAGGIALLSEAYRARSAWPEAAALLRTAQTTGVHEPMLETERGLVAEGQGDRLFAVHTWKQLMERVGAFPPAFEAMASAVQTLGDPGMGSWLVDLALSFDGVAPQVLRNALQIAVAFEPDGLHRATRIAKLSRTLLERVPDDAMAHLMAARALGQMGDRDNALFHLDRIDECAPGTAVSAEGQRRRFAVEQPDEAIEIDALLRAAHEASKADLGTIALRAHKFCLLYENLWTPHFAMGVAELRGERFQSASRALEAAVQAAPGALPAWVQLCHARIGLSDSRSAIDAGKRAIALGVDTGIAQVALAEAYLFAGERDEARRVLMSALELEPQNEVLRALLARIELVASPKPHAPWAWVKSMLGLRAA
jgi:tetratricopeptide (TPR) repeat protein